MLLHPDLLMDLQRQRQRDLVELAERGRLLALARRARRARAARVPAAAVAPRGQAAGQAAAGTLAACGPHAVASAR